MLLECLDCSTRFAVGLERCPHCGSTNYTDGDDMAKNTKARGATNAATGETGTDPEEASEDLSDAPASSASKAEWVEWAEAVGAPSEVLEGTKTEIQEWAAGG